MFLVLSCSWLYLIRWSQVLSLEWRCSWSSDDRRCSNYIWVINNLIVYWSARYIRDLMVYTGWLQRCRCNQFGNEEHGLLIYSRVWFRQLRKGVMSLWYFHIHQLSEIRDHFDICPESYIRSDIYAIWHLFNSIPYIVSNLGCSEVIWCHKTSSILVQVMTCRCWQVECFVKIKSSTGRLLIII